MARSIWSGALSFGLVSVPVKAYTATHDHSVHFNQLDEKGARIKYEKVSEKTGKPVEDIKLGYERSKGRYVTFDREEIEELRPASTKTVDPIYYEKTYWVAPDGEAAARAYALLLAAMEDQQKVGIGSVVMRNKQYLAAIRPLDGALAMSTMRFADEVISKKDIDEIPSRTKKPAPKELALANQIIDSLSSTWDPKRYHDTYTEVLKDLIERKAEGEEIEVERPDDGEGKATVVDLMAVLQASVEEARKGRSSTRSSRSSKSASKSTTKKRPAGKKAPVKKRAAAKKSA